MSIIQDMMSEVDNELAVYRPRLEGLRDFERVLVEAEDTVALQHIKAAIQRYQDRVRRLGDVKQNLQNLINDNYPNDNLQQQVPQAVYARLQANAKTIQEALNKFTPIGEAVSGTIIFNP